MCGCWHVCVYEHAVFATQTHLYFRLRTVDSTVHICTVSSLRKRIHLSVHGHKIVKCSFCAVDIVTVTTSSNRNDTCYRALLVSIGMLTMIMNSVTEGCDRYGF